MSGLGSIGPLMRSYTYASNRGTPNAVPDIQSLVALFNSGIIPGGEFSDAALKQGYALEWSMALAALGKNFVNVADQIMLWRRGKINDLELSESLKYLRVPSGEIQKWKDATEYFPNPADIVRFAVREVFTPETAGKFGQFEDIPPEYLANAAKSGLSQEAAKWYWGSHWDLPSANMGFDMFHRAIIDQDTLTMLLKALDVMPFWRDKLIQLAYNPITRVDVRRMYGMGVLTEADLPQKYQDMGYSPESAKLLTEFTVRYENQDTKGLTRAQVVKSYVDDLITRDELSGYLKNFGYSDDVVAFWVDQADYQKTEEDISLYTQDLVDQYLRGGKSLAAVKVELDSLELPSTYVQKVLKKLVLTKGKKLQLPSKEDLLRWMANGTISVFTFSDTMRRMGYEDWAIESFLTDQMHIAPPPPPKPLPYTVYVAWYTQRVIDQRRFIEAMQSLHYSADDIQTFIEKADADYAESQTSSGSGG